MTRLLATADLHIGAGADHRLDALADQERILNQIVEVTETNACDGVLIAGDVFHKTLKAQRDPESAIALFGRFTRQLADAGIPVVAITGNAQHDIRNADLPCALDHFATDYFRVSRVPELIRFVGDVAVCTLPNVPLGRLIASRGGGDREETIELATALLLDVAAELRAQVPEEWPSVLLGHWSVSGASLPNGLPVSTLSEPVLPVDELEALGFDAMVFGHIHKPQLFGQGSTFYTGSPMVHDFGEASFDHGVWIIDVDTLGVSREPEFVPLTDRRFVTVNVDLCPEAGNKITALRTLDGSVNGATNIPENIRAEYSPDETDAIAAAISEQFPLADAVVRVTYRATEEQHRRVDHTAIKALLDDAGVHKVYGGIHWDPVRETRARVAGVDEQLDPLAAVTAWCGANDVDDAPALALEQLTTTYLEGAAA